MIASTPGALSAADRGWAVLPLYAVGTDGLCTCWRGHECPTPCKHPRLDTGVKGASTNQTTIRRWFDRQWPARCNLGIATGQVSGLIVVDVDPKHDGFATLALLERELGPLAPATPRVRTGSGGLHVYLAYPADGQSLRNSAGLLGPGVDVRGDGGYVVSPPSVTNKGAYTWLTNPDASLAPILTAWLARMRPPLRPHSTSTPDAGEHGDASLPLGLSALEFIEHGVPYGQQRMRALAATRNLLALGTPTADVVEMVWQGLSRSEQEPGKRPWTHEDAEALVLDLERSPAPPVQDTDSELTRALSERHVRRVWHIEVR